MDRNRFFVSDIPRRKFLGMSLKGGIAVAAAPSLLTQLLSCRGAETKAAAPC